MVSVGGRLWPAVAPDQPREVTPSTSAGAAVLAVLPHETYQAVRGRPARFDGSHHMIVRHETVTGRTPLQAGAVLWAPRARIEIGAVTSPTAGAPTVAVARVTWFNEAARRPGRVIGTLYVSDPAGHRIGLIQRGARTAWLSALLPTIAQSFGTYRTNLDVPDDDAARVDARNSTLELVESAGTGSQPIRSALTFIVPTSIEDDER
jgi:hypothetical protein